MDQDGQAPTVNALSTSQRRTIPPLGDALEVHFPSFSCVKLKEPLLWGAEFQRVKLGPGNSSRPA